MKLSYKFQLLIFLIIALASASLFVMDDIMTIWSGAESHLLWDISKGNDGFYLPKTILQLLPVEDVPLDYRWPGGILFMSSLLLLWFITKPLFGKEMSIVTLLVLASSFVVPFFAKLATGDIWAFSFFSLAYFAMIRFLKQPTWLWRIVFFISLFGAILVHPLSAIIFFVGTSLFLYWKHPARQNIINLYVWPALLVFVPLAHFGGLLAWNQSYMMWNFPYSNYGLFLLFCIIGIFPFSGFFVGGIRDWVYKIRKNEELAIITGAAVIFGFFAQSLIIQLAFAAMIAKQMLLFNDEKYPFRNWVGSGAIVHIIIAFLVSILLMIQGVMMYGSIGFRSGLVFSIMYWSMGIIAIFGIYSRQRQWYIGASLLSGALSYFIFMIQVYPLIESERNYSKRITDKTEEVLGLSTHVPVNIIGTDRQHNLSIPYYMQQKFAQLKQVPVAEAHNTIKDNKGVVVVPSTLYNELFPSTPIDSTLLISGRNDHFESESWYILK